MNTALHTAAEAARTLAGSARHLATIPPDARRRLDWSSAAAVNALAGGAA